jgi:hypothetical protein
MRNAAKACSCGPVGKYRTEQALVELTTLLRLELPVPRLVA